MQLKRRLVPTRATTVQPTTAIIVSAAVVAVAAFGGNQILNTQNAGTGPIQATSSSSNFADGESVVVDDPAIASQGDGTGPRAVQEFRQDEEFSMFGITWEGDKDFAAYVRRQLEDGSWGEWYSTDPLQASTSGRNGTELTYVGPTKAVQVSVGNVDLGIGADEAPTTPQEGDAAPQGATENNPSVPAEESDTKKSPAAANTTEDSSDTDKAEKKPAGDTAQRSGAAALPTNLGDIRPVVDSQPAADAPNGAVQASELEAVFINGNAQEGGIAPAAESVTEGMPPVVSRAGWGADESIRCSQPTYDDKVRALSLHHTAGNNDYSPAESASIMRGIYSYHAQTLGWCDVGYNALVDKYGTIYEGRYGGLDKAVQGAHIGGFNSGTWGISLMGNYETAQPTEAMLNSISEIAGWKAAISGINPQDIVSLTSGGFRGSRYPAGATAQVPTFHGHTDLMHTQCPGRYVVAQWDTIREKTAQKYESIINNTEIDTPAPQNPNPQQPPVDGDDPSTEDGSGFSSLSSTSSGSSGSSSSQFAAASTIAAAVTGLAIANGAITVPEPDQEIGAGITVGQIPGIISRVINLTGNPELQQAWNTVLNNFGPVLGSSVGGPNMVDSDTMFQLFENGAVVSSENTGTFALIGEIAKAWAAGNNAEELGLPTAGQAATGIGRQVQMQFQGGKIVYNPETNKVEVFTD